MTTQQRGPFDRILRTTAETPGPQQERPDRAAVYVIGTIIGLALLLLILILPPISILSGGDDEGDIPEGPGVAETYKSDPRNNMPKLPAGLVAASRMFDLFAPEGEQGARRLIVPLREKQTDATNLALYSYVGDQWQRLSDAVLVGGGEAARGEVGALPGNVAVLRRSKATMQVAGAMPAGGTVDPRAEPVITILHPVVFLPGTNGEVIGQPPAVPPASYKVVPGIVSLAPDVVDNILRSSELQTTHANALAESVKQGNFAGINIDYGAVNPTLREQLTTFVGRVAEALHADGRTLTLTLPLPRRVEDEIDTGAYDWEALGNLADTIEISPELDQELYFQNTEAALDYVTERVDRSKLLLSISSLSVERGGDGLRLISLDDALSLGSTVSVKTETEIIPGAKVQLVAQNVASSEGASGLLWDDTARSVTFRYPGRGGTRTVWIANAFSASFRLELARRYGLGGVAINDVSTQSGGADVWAPVLQLSDTGSLALSKPNGALFQPVWSTADGSVAPETGEAVTWTAPAVAGQYEVTVVVSDGISRSGQTITLDVVPPADVADPAP